MGAPVAKAPLSIMAALQGGGKKAAPAYFDPAPRKPHGMETVGRSGRPNESARERQHRLMKWAEGK